MYYFCRLKCVIGIMLLYGISSFVWFHGILFQKSITILDNNNNNEVIPSSSSTALSQQQRHTTGTTSSSNNKDNEIINNDNNQPKVIQQQQQQQNREVIEEVINNNDNNNDEIRIDVAYVVTITGCGSTDDKQEIPFHIAEGAAVLQHSIYKQHNINSNTKKYGYKLYAFYHPLAIKCAIALEDLGYNIQERDTPVNVTHIRGDILRSRIESNGCCGEKELIKLEAFTLTDHEIVVLLDLDTLILKPMDHLFDFILDSNKIPDDDNLMIKNNNTIIDIIPTKIDILYTTDYAMVNPRKKIKPTQGGFVIIRPNITVYNEFVNIILEGDFRDENGLGWGGKTGKFWGAMTFQGLIPYYYQILHPGRSVELNWCVWNNMCSPSRTKGVDKVTNEPIGDCFTEQINCEDCRNRPISDVGLTHFTVCQKPWTCQRFPGKDIRNRLCRAFHHAWFQTRSELEILWGRSGYGPGTFDKNHFFGYCNRFGQKGYVHITRPFGKKSLDSTSSTTIVQATSR